MQSRDEDTKSFVLPYGGEDVRAAQADSHLALPS